MEDEAAREQLRWAMRRIVELDRQIEAATFLAAEAMARTFPDEAWLDAWARHVETNVIDVVAKKGDNEVTAAHQTMWDRLIQIVRRHRQSADERTLPAARSG